VVAPFGERLRGKEGRRPGEKIMAAYRWG